MLWQLYYLRLEEGVEAEAVLGAGGEGDEREVCLVGLHVQLVNQRLYELLGKVKVTLANRAGSVQQEYNVSFKTALFGIWNSRRIIMVILFI